MSLRNGLICLLIYPDYTITDANGKEWRFDLHPYCGPTVLKKNGDPTSRIPSEKSPFWDAFEKWSKEHLPPPKPPRPALESVPTKKKRQPK